MANGRIQTLQTVSKRPLPPKQLEEVESGVQIKLKELFDWKSYNTHDF